jgi:hypothetical protein
MGFSVSSSFSAGAMHADAYTLSAIRITVIGDGIAKLDGAPMGAFACRR